jgi:hypothetical protein
VVIKPTVTGTPFDALARLHWKHRDIEADGPSHRCS